MGPIWVLSAPDGPHFGPMNLAINLLINVKDFTVIIQTFSTISLKVILIIFELPLTLMSVIFIAVSQINIHDVSAISSTVGPV